MLLGCPMSCCCRISTCDVRTLQGILLHRECAIISIRRQSRTDLVRTYASGRRQKKSKHDNKSQGKKAKSNLKSLDHGMLPSSKEEAIKQGIRGLKACVHALKAPKGIGTASQGDGYVRVHIDLPVMGRDNVVEDSLALAKELLGDGRSTKESHIYIVPDSFQKSTEDVVSYSTMMASPPPSTDDAASYAVFIAPRVADVGLVESLVSRSIPKGKVVVLLNPEWSPSLGNGDGGVDLEYTDFVQSFTTGYCFFPILIKPLMMAPVEGVMYRNSDMDSSSSSGDKPWKLFMQQQNTATDEAPYQLVGQMRTRPSSSDVESILYNAIAASRASGKENPLKKLFTFGGGS